MTQEKTYYTGEEFFSLPQSQTKGKTFMILADAIDGRRLPIGRSSGNGSLTLGEGLKAEKWTADEVMDYIAGSASRFTIRDY